MELQGDTHEQLGDYYKLNTKYPYPFFCMKETTLRDTYNVAYNNHKNPSDYENKLDTPHIKINSKDVDMDSFLKNIAYVKDKCNCDNFKPDFIPPIRVDYSAIEDANFERASLNPHSCGKFRTPAMCERPDKYRYNIKDYCQNYICDKPFNNYTKRKYIDARRIHANPQTNNSTAK